MNHRPSCYSLLDPNIRRAMVTYRLFGFIGKVMTEAMAYIELLEEDKARREVEDETK